MKKRRKRISDTFKDNLNYLQELDLKSKEKRKRKKR